jgi:hypothetical protein
VPDEPDRPFERDYSGLWRLPPPPKPTLSLVVIFLLAVVATMVVLALLAPIIRLARDLSATIFA